jgi:ABC-type cobalamin/Fe3+-siderophores transport system ATPase subunit
MLKIDQLTYSIEGKSILSKVSAELEKGKLYTIVGPNGAGKTSLLKILCRLNPMSSGEILLDGRALSDFSQIELARQISYVPQRITESIQFTVSEFILQARFAWSESSSQKNDQDILARVLDQCQISHLAQQSMSTLSGGESQRCLLAAALCQETPLILLDEVTAGLDPGHHDSICELISKINQDEQKTILWVTHDLNTALHYSDKILVMKDGELKRFCSPKELSDGQYFSELYSKKFNVLKDEHGKQFLV